MSLLKFPFFDNDVDGAREEIFTILRSMSNRKVIYFHGWDGFGVSAVLRSIAEVLPSRRDTLELCFDRIIYVDCSKWKNRRAVQRAIAEELKLDHSVMDILDEQDEEDDFQGVDEISRNEIDSVGKVIDQTLSGTKFMMIFLNGSDAEVDIGLFGIPRFATYGNNVMIWTFNRSCLTMHRGYSEVLEKKLRYTHLLNYYNQPIKSLTSSELLGLLHQEAATLVARIPCMLGISPTMVADCCLYELFLHYNFRTIKKLHWVAHASNHWICDGIIQGDRARDISNALRREIKWECDPCLLDDVLIKMFMEDLVLKDADVYEEGPYRWISVTSKNMTLHGMQTIPAATSTFFLAFETSDHPPTLPNGLFEHSSRLSVLILYCCAFAFASPPFLKCHSLRFLGLGYCADNKTGEADDHTEWAFLYNLWVLELRYTDWSEILSQKKVDLMTNVRELNTEGVRCCWQYTAHLQGRLPNLQRLRIVKPTCRHGTSKDVGNSFIDKTRMDILDLSGNCDMKILPTSLSKASSLEMLVLDGCDGLENIGQLPPSLKSFSFDGYGPALQWTPTVELPTKHFEPSRELPADKDISIIKISLEGCTKLENLFLRGLPNLVELDLSGTPTKILNFKTMVVQVPGLKRLFLIGCEHLRAIIYSLESDSEIQPNLELLCIDTRAGIRCPPPSINKNKSSGLHVHAVFGDARLALSLTSLMATYINKNRLQDVYFNIRLTSSPMYDRLAQLKATCMDKIGPGDPAGQYCDVLNMIGHTPMQAFPQPPIIPLDRHLEIAEGSRCVESVGRILLFYLMTCAESLYVHDVSISAGMPDLYWGHLRWCRVEGCPKLDTVFSSVNGFPKLETIWASDLLTARWVWSGGTWYEDGRYTNLQHLHLRSCPSLQFILPMLKFAISSFPSLETLHIIHCGDLMHVFVLEGGCPEELALEFPKLTTIHLHDLPKLRQICNFKMEAPMLETIKVRGCWSLRRLPAVATSGRGEKKPTVEIEKDVWETLEWDVGHGPDHFEAPIHSRYYKKKLPSISFLR